jgi:hypothetical protein
MAFFPGDDMTHATDTTRSIGFTAAAEAAAQNAKPARFTAKVRAFAAALLAGTPERDAVGRTGGVAARQASLADRTSRRLTELRRSVWALSKVGSHREAARRLDQLHNLEAAARAHLGQA